MFLNQMDVQFAQERMKDLRREADQERLASQSRKAQREYRVREMQRQTQKNSPLWARVWMLF